MIENNLNLIAPLQMALDEQGYTKFTPIQEQAIPELLAGNDLLGVAQTGTGKTASFALPILQTISSNVKVSKQKRRIKALILAPTRELAIQISDSFKTYGKHLKLRTLVVYGGVSQHPQTKRLRQGVDILVATPGRLLDLVHQKHIHLNDVEHFVLDEADLMLDMGMIDDVKKIAKYLPNNRQTMLFSATMPDEIEKLTETLLNNPVKVEVTPLSSTVDTIKQQIYFVEQNNKTNLLLHLLKDDTIESALIFSRTKHGANKIVSALNNNGFKADAIHGDKTQRARQKALKNFKERKIRVLVATDIAARGIDVAALSHVINYNLSEVPETYVHRIGRTGRSGQEGVAISFCSSEELGMLRGIQRLTGITLEEVSDHPFEAENLSDKAKKPARSRNRNRGRNRNRNRNQSQSNRQSNGETKNNNKQSKNSESPYKKTRRSKRRRPKNQANTNANRGRRSRK